MNKAIKVILIIIFVIILIWFLFMFIVRPRKIVINDVGPYKVGTTVITHVRWFGLRPITSGNIVLYSINSTSSPDHIAQVVGVPGDKIPNYAAYQSGERITGTVPAGFYMIQFSKDGSFGLIPDSQIYYLVW